MTDKQDIPEKYRGLYDSLKLMLNDEAFEVWCDNVVNDKRTPAPEQPLRTRHSQMTELAQQARDAVSGYSENNGARKAVEALAEAIEKTQR